MPTELVEQFEFTIINVNNYDNITTISNDDKLEMYKYYKQATCGNNNTDKPYFYQIKEAAKWNAWTSIYNMSIEDAMINYIKTFNTIKKNINN